MVGKRAAAARGAAELRIVERREEQRGVSVYDVYRGRKRVAWGRSDHAAAQRWIQRLGGVAPAPEADQRPAASPTRVWWSERG